MVEHPLLSVKTALSKISPSRNAISQSNFCTTISPSQAVPIYCGPHCLIQSKYSLHLVPCIKLSFIRCFFFAYFTHFSN